MTNPTLLAKNAFKNFLHLWHLGLQPSLSLETTTNGAIIVTSSVTSFSFNYPDDHQTKEESSQVKRSGRNSRIRRKNKRAELRINSTEKLDDVIATTGVSEPDSACKLSKSLLLPDRHVHEYNALNRSFNNSHDKPNLRKMDIDASTSLQFGDGISSILDSLPEPTPLHSPEPGQSIVPSMSTMSPSIVSTPRTSAPPNVLGKEFTQYLTAYLKEEMTKRIQTAFNSTTTSEDTL